MFKKKFKEPIAKIQTMAYTFDYFIFFNKSREKKEQFTKSKNRKYCIVRKKKCRDQDSNLGYCGHNAMY